MQKKPLRGITKRKENNESADYKKLSEALFQWFRLQRENETPVSGLILQQKALKLYKELKEDGGPGFMASNGWLSR